MDHMGYMALHYAIRDNCIDIVEYLIKKGKAI